MEYHSWNICLPGGEKQELEGQWDQKEKWEGIKEKINFFQSPLLPALLRFSLQKIMQEVLYSCSKWLSVYIKIKVSLSGIIGKEYYFLQKKES